MRIALVLFFFLNASLVYSQDIDAEDIDAEAFLILYLEDFSASNSVSQYFSESPHFLFGSHLMTPQSSEDAGKVIADIRSRLDEYFYHYSRVVDSNTLASIDGYILITILIHRYDSADELIDRVCSTYGLLQSETGFKILSWQPSDVEEGGRCSSDEVDQQKAADSKRKRNL